MEKWKSYLKRIIELPLKDSYIKRGLEIKDILLELSAHPFDLKNQYKNVLTKEKKYFQSKNL